MRAPPMGHDEHFLQRLDRIDREHVGLALGLYRDHELIRPFNLSRFRQFRLVGEKGAASVGH